jgi:hypothetical protein
MGNKLIFFLIFLVIQCGDNEVAIYQMDREQKDYLDFLEKFMEVMIKSEGLIPFAYVSPLSIAIEKIETKMGIGTVLFNRIKFLQLLEMQMEYSGAF